MRFVIKILLGSLLAAAFFVALINVYVQRQAANKVCEIISQIRIEEPPRVAIVFGAGLRGDGEPSPALQDRVVTAVELWRSKRVGKLLMSGDNQTENYDEPTAMKEAAMKLGVPETDIVLDFAGRRTYDTCYRAKEIFDVKKAVLITQEFHLNRAIYLCQGVGINVVGLSADRRRYPNSARRWWAMRETLAVASAWFDANIFAQSPVLGKKEPITP